MNDPCFITAMDVVTALGAGPEEVWTRMDQRESGIKLLSRFPQDRYITSVAAEIPPEVEKESIEGVPQKSRGYLLALRVGQRALDQAEEKGLLPDKSRTGLLLSTTKADMEELERLCRNPGSPEPGHFNPFVMALKLARNLNLQGPTFGVSCACASGLVALADAERLLRSSSIDSMLVIGVDILSDFVLSGFSSLTALSKRPCRPYDESRDGLSLGEGAGALLLTRNPSARQGALGIIKGWALAGDASHITAPSRQGRGLAKAFLKVMTQTGLAPQDISYINGHGTGTLLNDEMESQALSQVFGDGCPPVSSMKGYIGHTLGAAGVIEGALCLMALLKGTLPASLGFEKLGVQKAIPVAKESLKLPKEGTLLTVKCGFGGVNAVMALSGVPTL